MLYHIPFANSCQFNIGLTVHLSFANVILRKKVIALQHPAIIEKIISRFNLEAFGFRPNMDKLPRSAQKIIR
jgi:hypothetical protein